MKSELDNIYKETNIKIEKLRKSCKHEPKYLKKDENHSCVGRGSAFPRIDIVCLNCGTLKIIFRDYEEKSKIIKSLKKQKGYKDQRLNLIINEHELNHWLGR